MIILSVTPSSDANGSENDLKKVTVSGWWDQTPDYYVSGGGEESYGSWVVLRYNHYRYYKVGQSNGFAHALKYALRAKASETMIAAGFNPDTASDTDFAKFADYYFEYDSAQRVTRQKIRGGEEEFTYTYTENTDDPGIGEKNTWGVRTTVTDPDNNERRVYTNPTSSALVIVFEDMATNDQSYDSAKRNSAGWSTEHAFPTAISSVTEPSGGGTTLTVNYNANSGLIYEFAYYTVDNPSLGEVKGRFKSRSVKKGNNGTADLLDVLTWDTQSVGNASIYPVLKRIRYPEVGMTSPSTYEITNTFIKTHKGMIPFKCRKKCLNCQLFR